MSEPMYDEMALESFKVEDRLDLMDQVWQHVLSLQEYIIRLRNQVNALSKGDLPFPDPASDYIMTFCDHRAFPEFAKVMEDGEPKYKIPE